MADFSSRQLPPAPDGFRGLPSSILLPKSDTTGAFRGISGTAVRFFATRRVALPPIPPHSPIRVENDIAPATSTARRRGGRNWGNSVSFNINRFYEKVVLLDIISPRMGGARGWWWGPFVLGKFNIASLQLAILVREGRTECSFSMLPKWRPLNFYIYARDAALPSRLREHYYSTDKIRVPVSTTARTSYYITYSPTVTKFAGGYLPHPIHRPVTRSWRENAFH